MSAETQQPLAPSSARASQPTLWFAEPEAVRHCRPEALDPADFAQWQRLTRPRRRAEFLLGRTLRLQAGQDAGLSHSGGYAIALNCGGAINGAVDVEFHAHRDVQRLASFALAAGEARYLMKLGPVPQTATFYRLWVMKEALAKVLGRTLMATLADVSLLDAKGDWVPQVPTDEPWSLTVFEPRPQLSVAIAMLGESLTSRFSVIEWPSLQEVRWRRRLTISGNEGARL